VNWTAYGLTDGVAQRIESGWAGSHRATVAVAEDPAHAVELLSAGKAGGATVVVFYLSDQADDEADDVRVDALIRVAVVQTPGLRQRDGRATPAVLQVVDDLRRWMGDQLFARLLGGRLGYRGMTHIPVASGAAMHGYALTFSAVYAYETEVC
jgi:hypothetical protein